ncbi:HNH endonuclease [Singulisphaera sp. GP187]|uniref:HNH endonuclease n=1 Tax=Singulisphaera sp. GP187 TaxID=1882752 RepID=UPI00092ABE26|nr:HNH endonuclease [Singulisphaera sp. GP187]
MDAATRRLVRQRAHERCEYCRLPQAAQPFVAFHVEHIIARQHGGGDNPDNLCVACERCNAFKGPNLTGIDPETGSIERLFDPRHQLWGEHFAFRDPAISGLTPVGRTTVEVLAMNEGRRVQLRAELLARGEF